MKRKNISVRSWEIASRPCLRTLGQRGWVYPRTAPDGPRAVPVRSNLDERAIPRSPWPWLSSRPLRTGTVRGPGAVPGCARRAFTLIEMLVVIAIIAILAALLVGGLGRASESKVRSRVRAELEHLENAIKTFHKTHGFYPASNTDLNNTGTNQLFYELTGTSYNRDAVSFTNILGEILTTADVQGVFGSSNKGFVNSDVNKVNCLPNLKPSGHALIPGSSPPVRVLVVPYKGPGPGDFNPWHYNSAKPEHNPDSYDLWATVVVGGKEFTIGNWQD